MATTFSQLLTRLRYSSTLMRIIVANVTIFLILRLVSVVMVLGGSMMPDAFLQWVEMPSSPAVLASRPWTVVTYMFSQFDLLHILFNMLWLYWFGVIFTDMASGRRLMTLYVYGGLSGAALYLLAYNLLPVFSGTAGWLIGASAAVIAIVAATAVIVPDYKMNLLFFGAVSLKWVAIVTIALDLVGVSGANAGGHIAHLGGAIIGVIYGLCQRRGIDITAPVGKLATGIAGMKRRAGRPHFTRFKGGDTTGEARCSVADQAELDKILDKIKKSGYTSLTADERRRLFDVSSRIK